MILYYTGMTQEYTLYCLYKVFASNSAQIEKQQLFLMCFVALHLCLRTIVRQTITITFLFRLYYHKCFLQDHDQNMQSVKFLTQRNNSLSPGVWVQTQSGQAVVHFCKYFYTNCLVLVGSRNGFEIVSVRL